MTDITVTRNSSKDTQDIFYTKSSTPSIGDKIYDSKKQDSGKTISVVGDGYIEFEDGFIGTLIGYHMERYGDMYYSIYKVYDTDGTTLLGTYSSEIEETDYQIRLSVGQQVEIIGNIGTWYFEDDCFTGLTYEVTGRTYYYDLINKIKVTNIETNWIINNHMYF